MNAKLIATLLLATSTAYAGNPHHAAKFCAAMDNSGMASAPCEYSGFSQYINVSLDMRRSEAQKFCLVDMRRVASQAGFDLSGYRLNIRSPYSTGTIASCVL